MDEKNKTLLAIPIVIIKLPLLLLSAAAKHRRIAVIIVVAVVALVLISNFSRTVNHNRAVAQKIPDYQLTAPSAQIAPYAGQSPTRIYMIASFKTEKDGGFTLTRYYVCDKGTKWRLETKPNYFKPGDMKIYPR